MFEVILFILFHHICYAESTHFSATEKNLISALNFIQKSTFRVNSSCNTFQFIKCLLIKFYFNSFPSSYFVYYDLYTLYFICIKILDKKINKFRYIKIPHQLVHNNGITLYVTNCCFLSLLHKRTNIILVTKIYMENNNVYNR